MIVDYLRSCYRSKFLVNAETGRTVIGRYYRPPDNAQVYTEPTIFRSGIWIGKEYLDDEPGDTLEDFKYDKGEREFTVIHDLKRTKLAQVGCDKEIVPVAGANGFPLSCESAKVPDFVGIYLPDACYVDDGVHFMAWGQYPHLVPLERVGPTTWELTFDTGTALLHHVFDVGTAYYQLVSTEISLPGVVPMMITRWPLANPPINLEGVSSVPTPPFHYSFPGQTWHPLIAIS